jgi:hypothetical protein
MDLFRMVPSLIVTTERWLLSASVIDVHHGAGEQRSQTILREFDVS